MQFYKAIVALLLMMHCVTAMLSKEAEAAKDFKEMLEKLDQFQNSVFENLKSKGITNFDLEEKHVDFKKSVKLLKDSFENIEKEQEKKRKEQEKKRKEEEDEKREEQESKRKIDQERMQKLKDDLNDIRPQGWEKATFKQRLEALPAIKNVFLKNGYGTKRKAWNTSDEKILGFFEECLGLPKTTLTALETWELEKTFENNNERRVFKLTAKKYAKIGCFSMGVSMRKETNRDGTWWIYDTNGCKCLHESTKATEELYIVVPKK